VESKAWKALEIRAPISVVTVSSMTSNGIGSTSSWSRVRASR